MGSLPNNVRTYFSNLQAQEITFYSDMFAVLK